MPAQDPGGEQARPTVSRHRDPRRLHDLLHGRRRQSAARDERASPSRRGEHFSAPSAQAWPPSSSPPDLPVGWPTFARSGSNGDRAYGGDRRCCERPLRYLIERGIQARYKTVFPWATLVANVSACFALGLVTGTATATSPPQVQALIGTGLAGALSTLSTFSYQTLRLAEEAWHIRDCLRSRQPGSRTCRGSSRCRTRARGVGVTRNARPRRASTTPCPRSGSPASSPRTAHRQTTGHARRLPQTSTVACPITSAPESPQQSPPPPARCGSATPPDPTSTPRRSLPTHPNSSRCWPHEGTSRQAVSFFPGPSRIAAASRGKRNSRGTAGRGRAGLSACTVPVPNARHGPMTGHSSRFRPGPLRRLAAGLRSVKGWAVW